MCPDGRFPNRAHSQAKKDGPGNFSQGRHGIAFLQEVQQPVDGPACQAQHTAALLVGDDEEDWGRYAGIGAVELRSRGL